MPSKSQTAYDRKLVMLFILLGISISFSAWAQIKTPTDAASLSAGMTQYQIHCSFCHGRGDDGFAANLVAPNLVHAPTDSSLINLIRNGILGTDMPPALGMTDEQISQVAGYVRSLGRSAPITVAGDLASGKAIYLGKGGCGGCHMLGGVGGRMGPDLTSIGAMRSPSNLRTSIVDPSASLSGGWTMVHVTANTGPQIHGIRLSEDNFRINVRDSRGKIHSIAKETTSKIVRDLTKSSMPSYQGRLSAIEVDDLVAYLFSLRGAM